MYGKIQLVLVLVTLTGQTPSITANAVKRDIVGLDAVHLGNFGAISKLPIHPTFAHLGLTPQQAVGFINILLSNGFLHPYSLRLGNGQPYLMSHHPELFGAQTPFSGNLFVPSIPPTDPYFLLLFSNYARYLPFGIGSQGFYGSTGLPKLDNELGRKSKQRCWVFSGPMGNKPLRLINDPSGRFLEQVRHDCYSPSMDNTQDGVFEKTYEAGFAGFLKCHYY